MLPENQETERIPAKYDGRFVVESVAIWKIAVENTLPDRRVEALVAGERLVQKRKVQEDRQGADGR